MFVYLLLSCSIFRRSLYVSIFIFWRKEREKWDVRFQGRGSSLLFLGASNFHMKDGKRSNRLDGYLLILEKKKKKKSQLRLIVLITKNADN